MSSNVQVNPPGEGVASGDAPSRAGSDAVKGLRAGFPGPTLAGLCLVLAPLLAIGGTAAGISGYHAKGVDFVAGMVAHSTSVNVGIQLAQASMILLIIAVAGLASMISASRPGWGRVSGSITIVGLCGPISFESVYWGAWHLTDTAAHRAAAAQMVDQAQIIPRTIMNVTGPCLVIGFILLALGAAKAGVLRRPAAVALGITCLIPFGFISGHLAISVVGFVCTAIALVPLGVDLLRQR